MKRLIPMLGATLGAALLAVSALLPSGTTVAAPQPITVGLTGLDAVPAVTGPGFGIAQLTFDEATSVLTFGVTVSGLSPDQVTASHIHRGAYGVNGPIVHNLSLVGFTTISGSITLSAADVADLKAGNFYINVHSQQNPGGFARGQIYLDPGEPLRRTVTTALAGFNSGDVATVLARYTDQGLRDAFGVETREEAAEFLPEIAGAFSATLRSITNVVTRGETATARVEIALGAQIQAANTDFILDAGVWKIAGEEQVALPVPAGVTSVPLDMREFSFVYDRAAVAGGNVAFALSNSGQQAHELVLVKLPANVTLQDALQSDEEPEGLEFLTRAVLGPGDKNSVVFTQTLSAGNYGMVCFFPDSASGQPHAFLGMVSEFSVGGSGGSTVRPPNTGDAGLADSARTALPLFAAWLLFASAAGLALNARGRA